MKAKKKLNYDISKVITDFFLYPKKFFPPTFNHGIITSGVCADFSTYLVPILQKIGIEAHRADGESEFLHSWIIAKIGDKLKSIDLTRAIAAKDRIKGIPSDQTSQDWLYCSMEKMFAMQENRTITSIDGITLPRPITSKNYDEQQFINLIAQITQGNVEDNTFKKIVEQALRAGTSIEDSNNAELYESVKEGEKTGNEH